MKYVLIVEDDSEVRKALQEILALWGFAARSVSNGQEALALLSSPLIEPPCLILLDIMMPIMDGWEFLAIRAETQALTAVPVVILSATSSDHPLAKTVVEFLPKPVSMERLRAAIQPYFNG